MATLAHPCTETDVVDAVADALRAKTKLAIVGGGSKVGIGAPVEAQTLPMAGLAGVVNYDPAELVLTVRPGTPLAEVQVLVAQANQMLAFEPFDYGPIFGAAEGGATIGKLLSRVLGAHTRLRGRPSRYANANQPWTDPLDAQLRTAWLTPTDTPSPALIRSIADDMQRSPTAIRARLARVGCDPDVPGRELSPTAATLLGSMSGTTQGKT